MKRHIDAQSTGRDEEALGLFGIEGCMAALWPNESERPSKRWFKELQLNGAIPCHRIGRLIFFDPAHVRRTLDRKFKVEAN
jgi:hypothetical protein